jgi:hypothetical protein
VNDGRNRRIAILSRLRTPSGDFETPRLCAVAAEVTDATGAGIMLMSGEVPRGSICTTDSVSALIEQLQFDLGEGPCIDAFNEDQPVIEPNLAEPETPRWFAFAPPAIDAGACAVFGFPLHVGAARLGALNLYRATPGPLTDEQHASALLMADIAAQSVLLLQSESPPGVIAAELAANADFRYVVHQASGMVAAQLDITVTQALARLRGHAFANEQSLTEVATDVVARTLRFEPRADEWKTL